MTAVSQNGWAIMPAGMVPLTVDGVHFGPCHPGDAFTVLEYVATRFNADVERLVVGTCGCYNPRQIPGTNVWSNHASATAIDCNWQKHPLGARGTFNGRQIYKIRAILAYCDGVIRWGGDYTGTVDEMHFEINAGAGMVSALARKIRAERKPAVAAVDWSNPTVQAINFYFSEAYRAQQGKATLPYPPAGTAPTPEQRADRAARNAYTFLRNVDGVDPEPEEPTP